LASKFHGGSTRASRRSLLAMGATGLLAGMIGLGRHLGLLTVTEGIETQAQRELLEAAGCDVGQGFLLGRPADAAATTRLLASAQTR